MIKKIVIVGMVAVMVGCGKPLVKEKNMSGVPEFKFSMAASHGERMKETDSTIHRRISNSLGSSMLIKQYKPQYDRIWNKPGSVKVHQNGKTQVLTYRVDWLAKNNNVTHKNVYEFPVNVEIKKNKACMDITATFPKKYHHPHQSVYNLAKEEDILKEVGRNFRKLQRTRSFDVIDNGRGDLKSRKSPIKVLDGLLVKFGDTRYKTDRNGGIKGIFNVSGSRVEMNIEPYGSGSKIKYYYSSTYQLNNDCTDTYNPKFNKSITANIKKAVL